jgi:GNAT superfamily N-acetyltransferase
MDYKFMGICFIIIMLFIIAYCIYAIFYAPQKSNTKTDKRDKSVSSPVKTIDSSEALADRLLNKAEHYEDYVPTHSKKSKNSAPVVERPGYEISPLALQPQNIQNQVAMDILTQWFEEYEGYTVEQIIAGWTSNNNVLFVMVDKKTNTYIGCIGVDRNNFYPYISHLYVIPSKRKQGYARKLLRFAEEYVSDFGFDKARLWCDGDLVSYYEKQGWRVEDITSRNMRKMYIMTKNI